MSWQSQWGTVKASNARAAALYYQVSNVGKTIESSKKRVVWRLKVEEGREFEISLTHSLASGKKVLRVDGIVKYTSQSLSFGDWDYVFNLAGGHCVHIIIKPSVDLNDMYDLIVDGMSFRRLPDRLDPTKFQKPQGNVVTSATRTTSNGGSGSRNSSFTYNYSNGGYTNGSNSNGGSRNSSRENSFTPWECTQCTLVNEKPLAPICEACGHPKPDYISPESRQRAKTVASSPHPPPSPPRQAAKSAAVVFDMWQSPPPTTNAASAAFPAFTDSDGFPASSMAPSMSTMPAAMPSMAGKQQDISSMLSGLDFTPPPVEETSPPVEATLEPTPIEEEKAEAGDLWSSDMVNLNLKPEEKNPVQRSAKSYQTLEQARQLAPTEKVQVLPTPPPMAFPTYTAPQAPGGYYGAIVPAQPMMYNTVGNTGAFGMAPAPMGFGGPQANAMPSYGGFGGQQASPFMTAAPMNAPPRQTSMQNFGNDPFATLS
ncbi:hypothetical protein PR003_g27035 [Phytophthora rubi]|uniref:RanBP2-type domain-containing protein n=1 Tax=Phytophthora rubi TaxID=129364 RepID=A0A6A3IY91_9STRA|nr:hypothetical protein PR002_g25879 [Phytophthora rubi]KAE8985255.1 hypothetical protein PR001_g22940 [Phytophthora rubi]KAE9283765.1 hypothetical protein PR003_g27035 [Phytophthora rubi]